jgi:sulfite exporter TauE/SafE
MEDIDLIGMFVLGALGTGHCIGMCGPLVFAFPGRSGRFLPHVWYHAGRVGTYVLVGAALGAAGMALSARTPLAGVLRLAAAVVLGAFGLMRLGWLPEPRWMLALSLEKVPGFRRILAQGPQGPSAAGHLLTGAVFGLLPCGLSYGAFAKALGTGSAAGGALSALAFGLGTTPGLLLLGTGLAAVVRRYRRASDLLAGALMITMAVQLAIKAAKYF